VPGDPVTGAVIRVGFYGKLPARGDFLRQRLPRTIATAWDGWLEAVLPLARSRLDQGWEGTWVALKPWRFSLGPGLCGERGLSGVWLASADRAGRPFPFLLAAVDWWPTPACLDAAEALGTAAVCGTLAPEDLAAALRRDLWPDPAPRSVPAAAQARWWRADRGSSEDALQTPGWPDAEAFLEMLR
jgi:type VI secretion system protein ImpM